MRNRVSNPTITLGSTEEVEDEDSEYSENADARERISVMVDWKVRKFLEKCHLLALQCLQHLVHQCERSLTLCDCGFI